MTFLPYRTAATVAPHGGGKSRLASQWTVRRTVRGMRIPELARRSGLPVRTVRYYADERLIAPASTTEGGYRVFDDRSLRQLRFIRRFQRLGLPLGDIAALVRDADRLSCGQSSKAIVSRLRRQLDAVESQITELQAVRHELTALVTPEAPTCSDELCLCGAPPQAAGRRR